MVPKEQKLEQYSHFNTPNGLSIEIDKWVKLGWIVHQIIPITRSKSYWILLYKY